MRTKAGARVFVVENAADKRFLIRFGQGFTSSNIVTVGTFKRTRYFTRQAAGQQALMPSVERDATLALPISPELQSWIDDVIVPHLVREYMKRFA